MTTVFTTDPNDDDAQFGVEGADYYNQKVSSAAIRHTRRQGKPVYLLGWSVPNRDSKNKELTGGSYFIPLNLRRK